MGPFELMDLVGVDVGFEVAKSFTELSFGEPRWKPSPIQARMVAAGRLGRKTGRGYYEYPEEGPTGPDDPEPLEPGGGDGEAVSIVGEGAVAEGLRERADAAGFDVSDDGHRARSWSDARVPADEPLARDRSRCSCSAPTARWPRAANRSAWAFTSCPPMEDVRLAELTRLAGTTAAAAEAAERFFDAPRASTPSGWPTPRASCSAGSSASS